MAKKKNNVLNDDFDLDTEFDDIDLDFPDPFAVDDRKPILRAASGIIEGAKETATSTGFIKDSIKTIFPPTYGQAIDLADRVGLSAKSLYDESVTKIKPTLKQAKNAILKVVPPDSKYVPKQMKDVFDRWKKEKEEEVSDTGPRELSREGVLSATLNDMFQIQMSTDVENKRLDEGRQNLKDGMESVRYQSTLDAANRTAISTGRLENYQTTIGLNFQKKNLELTYRLLFAAQDSYKYAQEDSVKRDVLLTAIAKNTTLPEFVKIKDSEARSQVYKTKLFESISSGLFADRNAYIEKTLGNISKKITDGVTGFVQGARQGIDSAQMMNDGAQGTDKANLGGQLAGDFGVQYAGGKAASWLKDKLVGSKIDKKFGISDKGKKLGSFLENVPNKLNEFKKNKKYANDDSLISQFMTILQSVIPSSSPDISTVVQKGNSMTDAVSFTRRSERSINEVIPGFLARIYRELQVLRTGNKKIGLTKFSDDSLRFTTEEKLTEEIINKVAPKAAIERTQRDLDNVIKKIDPSGKKLSAEARDVLKERLLTNSADRLSANKERLGNYGSYSGEKESIVEEIVPVMRAYLAQMTSGEEEEFSKAHNALADGIVDPRAYIQQQLDLGNYSQLRKLGLVDKAGNAIQTSEIIQTYLKKQKTSSKETPVKEIDSAGRAFSSMAGHLAPKVSVKDNMKNFSEKAKSSFSKVFAREEGDVGVDVYVAGQLTAIFTASQIASGKFFDQASGAVITSVSDIAGAVVDAKGKTIIAKDDALKLVYYCTKTETFIKIQELGAKIKAAAIDAKEAATSMLGKVKATSLFSKMFSGKEDEETGVDVYIPGQITAILTAAQVSSGKFFDQASGAVIERVSDIAGAVVDIKGRTVINNADAAKLVYYNLKTKTFIKIQELGAKVKVAAIDVKEAATSMLGKVKTAIEPNFKPGALDSVMGAFSAPVPAALLQGYTDVKEAALGLVDVYVAGGLEPRITAAQLAAGELRDLATGKVITSAEMITGAVVDMSNKIRITHEEAKTLGYFSDKNKMFAPLSSLGGKITNVKNRVFSKGKSILSSMMSNGIASFKTETNTDLALPNDVYVEGDGGPLPRLTAAGFTNGDYTDAISGTVLKSEKDIDGPVQGPNAKLILTEFDLPKLKIFNITLRKWSPLWIAKKVFDKLWHFQTKVAPGMAGRNLGRLWRVTKWAARSVGSVLGMSARTLGVGIIPKDVYVQGEEYPRLVGYKFTQGEYSDRETGKMISNETEITGTVIDRSGTIVIDESDLDKLYIKDRFLSKYNPLKLIGLIAKGAKSMVKWGYATAKKNLARLGSFAVSAGSAVVKTTMLALGLRMPAQDVFVNGQKDAVLVGKDMKEGKYFSVKTNKAILSPSDIDGEVAGEDGQIVITKRDLASGLKTLSGKTIPIKSFFKRAISATFGTLGKIFNPGVKTKLKINKKDTAKMAVTDGESAAMKSAGTLDQILLAMKKLIEKPKGVRSGSYMDEVGKDKVEDDETAKRKKEIGEKEDKKKSKSLLSRIKGEDGEDSLLGSGFKALAGKALGTVGLGGLFGGGAAAATTVAAGTAGAAAAGTAATAGTAAAVGGGVIAAIGGGLLAFVTSPVTLAVAAIALTAYAGYKAFKYFTRGSVSAIQKVRMAQYGVNPEDTGFVKRIIDLERYLSDFLVKSPMGYSIEDKKISAEKIMKFFDLNYTKENERSIFFGWYQNRFKPIFLTHVTALSSLKRKTDLAEIDDLKTEEQHLFLESVKFPNGPYQHTILPMLGQKVNATTAEQVDKYVVAAQQELIKAKEKESKRNKDPAKEALDKVSNTPPIPVPVLPLEAPASKAPLSAIANQPKPNSLAQQAMDAPPDSEPAITDRPSGDNSEKSVSPSGSSSGLAVAGGAPIEGLANSAFLKVNKAAKFEQINPAMREQLVGMAEEYGKTTGKTFDVTNAFRSYDDQMAMKKKYGARAASPGKSLHEFGIALDVPSATMDEVDKLGLARKYGFTRPVGAEPWHVEPIGVQDNIDAYKKDPNLAAQAIKAGVGLGGGGIGSVSGSKPYSRNIKDSAAIMASSVKPTDNKETASGSTNLSGSVAKGIAKPESVASAKSQLPVTAGVDSANETLVDTPSAKPASLDKAVAVLPQTQELASISKTPLYSASKPPLDEKNSSPSASNPTIKDQVTASSNAQAKLPADPSLNVPLPVTAGVDGVKETIIASSKMVGVDPNEMLLNAAIESGFNPNAKAKTSSAKGLFQFLDGTWKEQVGKHGSKYGFDNSTPATDPRAASIMAAHMLKSSKETLRQKTTRPIGATEGYLAHFLGTGGAGSFLRTLDSTPNAPAAQGMRSAAAANKAIFYDQGRERSYSGVYALMNNKLNAKAKEFGINLPTNVNAPAGPVKGMSNRPPEQVDSAEQVNANLPPNNFPKQAGPIGGMPGTTSSAVPSRSVVPQEANSNVGTITEPMPPITQDATAQAMTRNAPSVPNGSMASAYGFNMPNTASPVRPAVDGGFNKSLLNNTEGLLTKQLDIQTQMLALMNKMFGLGVDRINRDTEKTQESKKQPSGASPEKKQSEGTNSYSPPKPAVSMKRVVTT